MEASWFFWMFTWCCVAFKTSSHKVHSHFESSAFLLITTQRLRPSSRASSSAQLAEHHPRHTEQRKQQCLIPPRKEPTSLTQESLAFLPKPLTAFPTNLQSFWNGKAGCPTGADSGHCKQTRADSLTSMEQPLRFPQEGILHESSPVTCVQLQPNFSKSHGSWFGSTQTENLPSL